MTCSGPRRGNQSHNVALRRRMHGACSAPLLILALLAGCASEQKPGAGTSASTGASTARAGGTGSSDADLRYPAELDASYLVGPTAARDLDLRIDWQKRVVPAANSGIKRLAVTKDAVLVLDGRNMLTQLRRQDGNRMWTLPVAGPVDAVLGFVAMPESERLYVAVSDALLVLDSTVGSLVGRQRFERVANTAPVIVGNSLVYGSLNGQLVWHNYNVGTQWRAYQVADSISTTPVVEGSLVIVTGSNGMVMALNAESATQLWSKKLLDEIVAPPVVGDGAVFVAGTDQSLWAFELGNGRGIWRYRTESPLTEPPTKLGDRVYQFVPGQGLVCLEAVPLDLPAGRVIWKAADVSGRVITKRRETLLVWDAAKRTLTTVAAGSGHLMKSVALPGVRHLESTSLDNGELFAAGDDGRIIHLVWKN